MHDEVRFRYLVDSETEGCLGLIGLLGSALLLKDEVSSECFEYALNKVRKHILPLSSGKGLSIGNNRVSPYFDMGSAGYIQALLYLDREKYLSEITEIVASFDFEFAQRPAYNDGMLGIADTLLRLYEVLPQSQFLTIAEKLLLNTSFYVYHNRVATIDFAAVLRRFRRLTNEKDMEK